MNFDAWHENYSKLYQVKVFPETWEIFSIDSSWEGKTFGGRNYTRRFLSYHYQHAQKEIWKLKCKKWKIGKERDQL